MSELYYPPVDLHNTTFSGEAQRYRCKAHLKCLLEMHAFWHITETKKNDSPTLHCLFEDAYLRALDTCPYIFHDSAMKEELKEGVKGDGDKAWQHAKDYKRKMLDWTCKMNPSQRVTFRTTNCQAF